MHRVRFSEARRATTGDLLNIAKALFAGPDLVKLHATAAHPAILGADIAPRIAPTRATTRRFSVRSCLSELGGAKRARTADLLHAIWRQHVHPRLSVQVTVLPRPRKSARVQVSCCTSVLYEPDLPYPP
jgi:hypothetical protein